MTTDAQVMLVAGGTGSIGRVIAREALRAGWAVAVHGSGVSSIEPGLAWLRGAAGTDARVVGIAADVAETGAVERLVAEAGGWRGRIDAVVDCIAAGPEGIRLTGPFTDTGPEGYAPLLALSAGTLQRLAHAALPWLARQGGTLVAFASDAGRFAAPRQALIGASRAAIIGFVRNLAVEVAREGVRVHCVSPGFVEATDSATRPASGERLARARARAGLGLPTPEDIAPLVLFLCGEGARRITGQVISVNGGTNA